jgi:hypothetical protein
MPSDPKNAFFALWTTGGMKGEKSLYYGSKIESMGKVKLMLMKLANFLAPCLATIVRGSTFQSSFITLNDNPEYVKESAEIALNFEQSDKSQILPDLSRKPDVAMTFVNMWRKGV